MHLGISKTGKSRGRKATIAAIIALTATALSGQAAAAAPGPGPGEDASPKEIATYVVTAEEPKTTFEELPSSQQQAFKTYMLPTGENEVGDVSIAPANEAAKTTVRKGNSPHRILSPYATGCWYGSATGWVQNGYGNNILEYTIQWDWCASGTSVTSASYRSGTGTALILGWRYNGVIQHDAGVVGNTGRAFNQHDFTLDVGGWTVDSSYPCLRGFGDYIGNTSADYGCGVV